MDRKRWCWRREPPAAVPLRASGPVGPRRGRVAVRGSAAGPAARAAGLPAPAAGLPAPTYPAGPGLPARRLANEEIRASVTSLSIICRREGFWGGKPSPSPTCSQTKGAQDRLAANCGETNCAPKWKQDVRVGPAPPCGGWWSARRNARPCRGCAAPAPGVEPELLYRRLPCVRWSGRSTSCCRQVRGAYELCWPCAIRVRAR